MERNASDSSGHIETAILNDLFSSEDPKNTENFYEFLKIFDRSRDQGLEKLSDAVLKSDFDTITSTAHSFKGAAANIGAPKLVEICKKMEDAGKLKSADEVSALCAEFRKEIILVRKALEDYGQALAARSAKK